MLGPSQPGQHGSRAGRAAAGRSQQCYLRCELGRPGLRFPQRLKRGGADMAPSPEGQHRTLGFPCSVWPRVTMGLLLYLAIKPWMNRPGGLRELSPSGLESPDLPLRVCCWPGGMLWPCVQAHTQVCTLQFTTWRPHTVNEIPCSRRGWRWGMTALTGPQKGRQGLCLYS